MIDEQQQQQQKYFQSKEELVKRGKPTQCPVSYQGRRVKFTDFCEERQ